MKFSAMLTIVLTLFVYFVIHYLNSSVIPTFATFLLEIL